MHVSDSGQVQVDSATGAQTLIQGAEEWALLTVKLQGTAGGVNTLLIGRGSTGMLVEAADLPPTLLIAPGTQVRVSTTSSAPVTWGWAITYVPINGLVTALAYSMAYLNIIACALAGPDAVAATDKEVSKAGIRKVF